MPSICLISVIIICAIDLRRVMLHAHALGMCNGEYVFLHPTALPMDDVRVLWRTGDDDDVTARDAFRQMFYVSTPPPPSIHSYAPQIHHRNS
jgi:hypothetical protein